MLNLLGCAALLASIAATAPPVDPPSAFAVAEDGPCAPALTTNRVLEGFLADLVGALEGGEGRWSFQYLGLQMMVITDEAHDRMRIVLPVAEAADLDKRALQVLLEANFDRALDAKYAIYNGVVWSTYVHPLGGLGRAEFVNAVNQVVALHKTYGTTFSSTDLWFLGQPGPDGD